MTGLESFFNTSAVGYNLTPPTKYTYKTHKT